MRWCVTAARQTCGNCDHHWYQYLGTMLEEIKKRRISLRISVIQTGDTYPLSFYLQQPIIISIRYHNHRLELLMEYAVTRLGNRV